MGRLNKLEWKNIYYMLCYCADELQYFQPSNIEYEEITGTHDLLAVLLNKSFEILYKNGYLREYNTINIVTDKPRGKIDIPKSIKTGTYARGNLVCKVTNLDINNELNQIIKSAFTILIDTNNAINEKISNSALTQLYSNRELLRKVDDITVDNKVFDLMSDIPQWYKPIMVVCRLIINDWLALDKDGKHRLLELKDEKRLRYIWQKYLLAFCKKQFKQYKVYTPVFSDKSGHHWNTDLAIEDKLNKFTLIADAKWYESSDMSTGNISQVNMYESLYIREFPGYNTTGLLLYASNDITKYRPTIIADNGKSITEVCINVNQDKEALESDILNCIETYMFS